jgi:asparagine synthase (glutamine-hydrolysing)
MPGLFGAFEPFGEGRASSIAQLMLQSMRHHKWYGSMFDVDERREMAWGRISLDRDLPDVLPVSGRSVILEGEIYDSAAHRHRLEKSGARFSSEDPAELLAHGLAIEGEHFLRALNGCFVAAVWEPAARVLTLLNDRFGMKPFYFAAVAGAFVFSTEVKAILCHRDVARTLSPRGVSQFFTFGHLLGSDTLFEHVHALGPASIVRFDGAIGTTAQREYWRMDAEAPVTDTAEAFELLEQCFAEAVERRTHGSRRLGLSLSGGLDARTILAVVPRSRPVRSVSVGIHGSIDHRVASELARQAGAQHHCHFLSDSFLHEFPSHLETLVRLTDGHYLDQAITVPTLPVYRELGIDVVLRGHAGELFHMDKAYAFSIRRHELDFKSGAAVEAWLWSHLTEYMIGGIGHQMFRPSMRGQLADEARDSLRTSLSESEAFEPPAQRLWHLFIRQRLRRETAMSMQMFNSVADIRLPYIDNALVSAIMRIAPIVKLGDTIQTHILRRRMPSFLKVVNANTGTQMGASQWQRNLSSLRLRVFSKLRVPGYQPYERLGLWLSRELQPFVRKVLLSDRALDRALFERNAVKRIIESHAARTENHTFQLMGMLIFEIGQRQLVDGDRQPLARDE